MPTLLLRCICTNRFRPYSKKRGALRWSPSLAPISQYWSCVRSYFLQSRFRCFTNCSKLLKWSHLPFNYWSARLCHASIMIFICITSNMISSPYRPLGFFRMVTMLQRSYSTLVQRHSVRLNEHIEMKTVNGAVHCKARRLRYTVNHFSALQHGILSK